MELMIRYDTPTAPHKRHWQFCVGAGHALLALRTDFTRQLKLIHDTLGIERVRFHGIFCDDMRTINDLSAMYNLPGAKDFTEYNFNQCGVAYDNVLSAGMKPFVELSFMPRALAVKEEGRQQDGAFFYRPVIVPPENVERYQKYIQAFLHFMIHRYGIDEVRTWYFEVWNEPDIPVAFWNGTQEEYFKLYEATVRAIKEVDPSLKVGGPATSSSKWVKAFIDWCAKRDLPVDFVSTHQYAGDPLGGVTDQGGMESVDSVDTEAMKRNMMESVAKLQQVKDKTLLNGFRVMSPDKSETTDIPSDLFRRNAAIVRQQAGNLPLFYTEWNENAIFSASTNDTRKVAAYDVRAALDVADSIDGSSIWCFSDIFEELHPFPQEFHGGFGILTQNGVPKPVYHALKMLHDAGDERLQLADDATQGEIGYAAFRKGEDLQVLLFRQKMKQSNLPKESVTLKIALPVQPVAVTMRRIDENHGNPLSLWEDMGSPVALNAAEVQMLKDKSAVEDVPCDFSWEDGCAIVQTALGVNDVVFLQFKMKA
jgi:xylan 1,4-beta-xylosidase